MLLHRGTDAHVNFLRKPPDGSTSSGGIAGLPIPQVITEWPRLSGLLDTDGYFSVNSSYSGAPYVNKETGYRAPWRKEKYLKSLNACYVDLDIGRPDSDIPEQQIPWRRALAMTLELALAGTLPMPTMVSVSGRGLHLYWVLEGMTYLFYPNIVGRRSLWHDLWFYKRVNQALARILQPVSADLKSFDGARVLRAPGTRHSTTGRRTLFMLLEDQSIPITKKNRSQVWSYALDRLADFLGVVTTEATPEILPKSESSGSSGRSRSSERSRSPQLGGSPKPVKEEKPVDIILTNGAWVTAALNNGAATNAPAINIPSTNVGSANDGATAPAVVAGVAVGEVIIIGSSEQFYARLRRAHLGRKQLYTLRYQDLELVEKKRKGWKRGHRRARLYLYAMFLRGAGHTEPEVLSAVGAMARRCKPPYPSDGADTPLPRLVHQLWEEPLRFYRNSTLVSLLRITPELARELNLRTIVPDEVTLERKPRGGQRRQRQTARHTFIQKYLAAHGGAAHGGREISCRKLQQAFKEAGFTVSHETVNQDLRALRKASDERQEGA